MKSTAKIGITLVTIVALPVALATEWVTQREAVAATNNHNVAKTDIVNVSDNPSKNGTATENVASEMKIYVSF
jgi:hypothetical protein